MFLALSSKTSLQKRIATKTFLTSLLISNARRAQEINIEKNNCQVSRILKLVNSLSDSDFSEGFCSTELSS